jgi:WD40 repeat protein
MVHGNVIVTYVAWSLPQNKGKEGGHEMGELPNKEDEDIDSLIAAAGSNGIVAIWNARQLLFSQGNGGSSTMANQQPEAILNQHTRAVNSLAWHPRRPGLLLTASQVRQQILKKRKMPTFHR